MKTPLRLAAAALALAPALAPAATLYKSVDANGVVMFSDRPPAGDARVIEERPLPSVGAPAAPAPAAEVAAAVGDEWFGQDAALARANARVDLAESALANALRELGASHDPMRLRGRRATPAEEARVAQERRNVDNARRELVALMRERQVAFVRHAIEHAPPAAIAIAVAQR